MPCCRHGCHSIHNCRRRRPRRWLGRINESCVICDRSNIIAGYTYSRTTHDVRQSPLLRVPSSEILRDHARGLLGGRAASCRRRRRGVSRNALAQFVPFASPRCVPRFWLRLSQSIRADAGEGRLSQGNVERCAFGKGRAKDARRPSPGSIARAAAPPARGLLAQASRPSPARRKWIASI
jgi:hypothetical protein